MSAWKRRVTSHCRSQASSADRMIPSQVFNCIPLLSKWALKRFSYASSDTKIDTPLSVLPIHPRQQAFHLNPLINLLLSYLNQPCSSLKAHTAFSRSPRLSLLSFFFNI